MRKVLTLAFLLLAAPAFAQIQPSGIGEGVTAPIFGLPVSAVSGSGGVSASLIPTADNTFDLGSSSLRWRNVYWGTQALGPDGSASAPSYSFASDTTKGWYLANPTSLGFSGHLLAGVDNTYDIGASGSEPRSVRAKTSFGGASATGTLVTNDTQTVANDAVINIGGTTSDGLFLVQNDSEAPFMVWLIKASSIASIVSDPGGNVSVTAGTANKYNVYYSAGWKLENKRGASRTIRLIRLGV